MKTCMGGPPWPPLFTAQAEVATEGRPLRAAPTGSLECSSLQELIGIFFSDQCRAGVDHLRHWLPLNRLYRGFNGLFAHVRGILSDHGANRSGLNRAHRLLARVKPNDENLSAQMLRGDSLHRA